jgi:hypothetical protein
MDAQLILKGFEPNAPISGEEPWKQVVSGEWRRPRLTEGQAFITTRAYLVCPQTRAKLYAELTRAGFHALYQGSNESARNCAGGACSVLQNVGLPLPAASKPYTPESVYLVPDDFILFK